MPSRTVRGLRYDKVTNAIIHRFPINKSTSFVDCIVRTVRLLNCSVSEDDAYIYADENERKIRSRIASYVENCATREIPPRVNFHEQNGDIILGRSFIFNTESVESATIKRRLALMDHIWKQIRSPQMPSRSFEGLCKMYVEESDFFGNYRPRSFEVTGRRADGGIDFKGTFHNPVLKHNTTVLGQAKRYNRKVELKTVKEFGGTVLSFLSSATIGELRDPERAVIFIFVTSSDYTKGAKTYANENVIKLVDGEQMAYFVAKKGIGVSLSSSGKVSFSLNGLIRHVGRGH